MKARRRPGARRRWPLVAGLLALALAAGRPAAAQDDAGEAAVAFRPFLLVSAQAYAARDTFEAAFGQSLQALVGGGLSIVSRRFFVDLSASRFRKTGERAFRSGGETFRLGIPLTVAITPLELAFGYRFRPSRRIVPFAGAGLGSYRYEETSGESDPEGNVDARHIGYLAVGGAEFLAARWLRVALDAHYTRVPGILGAGGISQQAGEDDLGGTAVRLRVIVGP
ncbi:MAG: hypothetical protein IT176_01430 [Acidobacteria bacterium]|nr:hypothetical protein [Acidobacteriota bacterium]